ncbi:MAG: NAD(+)/NADH kinase [Coriobacteriales bacterium]|nr:NAD(+)/NADH kinase [Coriobacteriales bacterium]
MQILIVNNPMSGLRDGAVFTFIRQLSLPGDEIVLRNIDDITPISEYVADAALFDLVVVAGGDGTISAACYALRYSGIPILPFRAGTGNLLVTNLELPDEPYALAALARQPYMLDFDMGEITFDNNGASRTRGFTVAAGSCRRS